MPAFSTRRPILCCVLLCLVAALPVSAATFVVTNTNDSGAGSLRQALLNTNTTAGTDTINFNILGAGVQTIQPLTALPGITDPVMLDGYSQPGASVNTLPVGSNANIRIEIRGPGTHSFGGLSLLNGSAGSTIRGLAINRFGFHLTVVNSGASCMIRGNFIGTDPTGTIGYPGGPATQVGISMGSENCWIGGPARADRNVISGLSGYGVSITGSNISVQGNLIGTNALGTAALGNEWGISVGSTNPAAPPTRNVLIGGANSGVNTPRNVISGNTRLGIQLLSGDDHWVNGNLIGLAAFPLATIPNGGPGIVVNGASDLQIGGARSGDISNSIFGNTGPGILVTNREPGEYPQNVEIYGNAISNNAGLPIELAINDATGVTPNDPLDADVGPNGLQNFPELTGVIYNATQTRLLGRLHAAPSQEYWIDFYEAANCHPSGHGGATNYLTGVRIFTNAAGNATFHYTFDELLMDGFATVTATQYSDGSGTSEYSRCFKLGDVLFQHDFEPAVP